MNIKKGDTVKIITGKDREKSGKITRVLQDENKVLVEGLNLFKKTVKPKQQGQKGEIISVARPVDASNVMMVCPSCKKAVRVGYRSVSDKKVRYCKKCNADLT